MYYRLSRIRFIVVRSCFISFIIILFLQIVAYFNHDTISSTELLTNEQKFWRKISNEAEDLSDKQRIKLINLIDNQYEKEELNWTKILFDSYKKKLIKFNERDSQTTLKYHFTDNQQKSSQQIFQIYEETLVFGNPKFCSSTRIFHPQCPYSNCRWSCENSSINHENLRRANVFHHIDIKEDAMREKLAHRSYNDIWILWIDEANREITHLNQYKFNWTLSFRQDSEVSIGSYGILIERNRKKMNLLDENADFMNILKSKNIQITNKGLENRILTNYRYRYKHALWFVSNCGPQHRLKYYEKLKIYYPIKAFGSCVEQKCDKDNCEYDQSHLALFYLSFESQTCKDYITEKFWRALYYGMIPIVLGPSKQSYLDLGVPESAFIHIDDFKSEIELADYLHKISNNYFLYREYFQWLNQYDIFYDINELEPIRMCELCMRLNMQEYQYHSFYINVHEWHRTAC